MKEAKVYSGPKVEIVDSPVPSPSDNQVLLRVVVSGSNPKDWKLPEWMPETQDGTNQGDDIAGVVVKVGKNVTEFKPGDRVAAFHQMTTPGGSYGEYGIAEQHTTFHIPEKTSFEEASTIPLAAMTSAVGLYIRLGMPAPYIPASKLSTSPRNPGPILIYGAASAVGSFAVQFARHSGIHPIICVAGNGTKHVETLISRDDGDEIVDYRNGDDALVQGIRSALNGRALQYAFDAVSANNSWINVGKVLDPRGKATFVLPNKDNYPGLPESIERSFTSVGDVHGNAKDFGFLYFRLMGRALAEGWFRAHPYEVRGGLEGVEGALKDLKAGKASAVKYVFRVGETQGAGQDKV